MNKWLIGLLVLLALPARGDRAVTIEATGEAILIPDLWWPIPRAEIIEAHDRALSLGLPVPFVEAAFQRLPTLQWFKLPYLTVRISRDCAPPDGPWRSIKAGVSVMGGEGSPRHLIGFRVSDRACYVLDYLTEGDDEAVFLGMLESLGTVSPDSP